MTAKEKDLTDAINKLRMVVLDLTTAIVSPKERKNSSYRNNCCDPEYACAKHDPYFPT